MTNQHEIIKPLQQIESPFPPPIDVDDQRKALFVGAKYQTYYKEKFDLITPKKQMAGFNIAAFFLGIMWLFYRKMYAYGFIAIGLTFVVGIIETMIGITGTGSSIAFAVVFGLMGNTLYKYFVDKKISTINSNEDIEKAGGTNIWAALAVLGIAIFLVSSGYYLESQGY